MDKLSNGHWTSRSTDDFLYRIASDFVGQIETAMDESGTSQAKLAEVLGVSEGRVSQILTNPGNLTLRKVIEYARALGKKVSVITYDDNDPDNLNGPVNSEIFTLCWKRAGEPTDFFAFDQPDQAVAESVDSAESACSSPLPFPQRTPPSSFLPLNLNKLDMAVMTGSDQITAPIRGVANA
jgi:transcriptional regulator with XRE-family HTH domain